MYFLSDLMTCSAYADGLLHISLIELEVESHTEEVCIGMQSLMSKVNTIAAMGTK